MTVELPTLAVDEVLGEGAWGKVYRVHNQRAESFALKVLKADAPHIGPGLEAEVRVLARLAHPHLVRIEAYLPKAESVKGVAERGPGLLLEYVDGPPLPEGATAPFAPLLNYFVQALQALAYLHARRLM